MTNITMSSFETRSSEEVMNTQLGGEMRTLHLREGRKTMRLGDQTGMSQEEKGSNGAEWIIKDTEMSKTMLEAIWYKTEWILPGCIGKTRVDIQWLQAPSALVREFGQPQFLLTSG